ncbi:SIMPL domain-containing protein [Lysobacter pythonis]|uniref:SIMPL domain-containing protein n=1 Tax=Solilutibacter pythonis TaxID=2483112 RepID=A0A3M2HN85_9GAMM|nr:SIMPL domain-containing protein [Lysobacter pythonis]RMH91176.1 SIMPL domain-containing protein [Lysobacter pythonis]
MNTANAQSALAPPTVASSDGTLLSVSAEASSTRVPDIAMISTGVVSRAADTATAMRQNAEQMAKVMAALKQAGIAERDIQTSGINLNPQYHYQQNETPKITGYEARNTVSVKVRDLSKLGKTMDTLVAQGANELNGPNFQVDKPDEAYDEARRGALEKAQARAGMYAKTLGLRVRRIVSIDETGGYRPPVPMMRAMAMDAKNAGAETAVAPGESTLSVNLNIVFELGR